MSPRTAKPENMDTTLNLPPDSIKAYSRIGLHAYDPLIMCLLVKHVWGCDAVRLVDHYREHVTSNHADIGVGTALCLDRCGFPVAEPRIALIDLQPNCLEYAARRLARYEPETYIRDAWQTMQGIPGPRFESIALGGILHCLKGDLRDKSAVFDNIAPLAKPGTKIFGYTLVSDGVASRLRSRITHRFLNFLRVIDNAKDRVADLECALSRRFVNCRVERVGCMALFSAIVPHGRVHN